MSDSKPRPMPHDGVEGLSCPPIGAIPYFYTGDSDDLRPIHMYALLRVRVNTTDRNFSEGQMEVNKVIEITIVTHEYLMDANWLIETRIYRAYIVRFATTYL